MLPVIDRPLSCNATVLSPIEIPSAVIVPLLTPGCGMPSVSKVLLVMVIVCKAGSPKSSKVGPLTTRLPVKVTFGPPRLTTGLPLSSSRSNSELLTVAPSPLIVIAFSAAPLAVPSSRTWLLVKVTSSAASVTAVCPPPRPVESTSTPSITVPVAEALTVTMPSMMLSPAAGPSIRPPPSRDGARDGSVPATPARAPSIVTAVAMVTFSA